MTGMINTIKDAFPTFEDEQDGKKLYFVSKIVLWEKKAQVIEKNFWNTRQKFWDL